MDEIEAKIRVWKGFRRTLNIKHFSADKIDINIIHQGEKCNYKFLKHGKTGSQNEIDYREIANNLLEKTNNFCPADLSINHLTIQTHIDSDRVRYALTDLQIRNGKGSGKASIQDNEGIAEAVRSYILTFCTPKTPIDAFCLKSTSKTEMRNPCFLPCRPICSRFFPICVSKEVAQALCLHLERRRQRNGGQASGT